MNKVFFFMSYQESIYSTFVTPSFSSRKIRLSLIVMNVVSMILISKRQSSFTSLTIQTYHGRPNRRDKVRFQNEIDNDI